MFLEFFSSYRVDIFGIVKIIDPSKEHTDVFVECRGGLSVNNNVSIE
jgi:hypothetical protein